MLRNISRQFFPLSFDGPSKPFVEEGLKVQSNIAALTAAAHAITQKCRLEEFRDIANAKLKDEEVRQASAISRAQALFVALALFGVLFTFVASGLTSTSDAKISTFWFFTFSVLLVYMLIQIVIMVTNVIKVMGGLEYPTSGASDLAKWLSMPSVEDFLRAQALLTLEHYRYTSLNNSWRFTHLGYALRGLRNIVFAVSTLIATMLAPALMKLLDDLFQKLLVTGFCQ